MEARWLNFFLKYSAYTFSLKQKIAQSGNWTKAFPHAVLLLISELGFAIVSIPLYVLVPPKNLQESGVVFPKKEKDRVHFNLYVVRRKISLTTVAGAAAIWAIKVIFIGAVSFYLLGAQPLLASTQNWDFNNAGDYAYDTSKIAVTGGVAQLVDQGGGGSCGGVPTTCSALASQSTCQAQGGCSWNNSTPGTTTNSAFASNATGWIYADWIDTKNKVSGAWSGTGGNPSGNIRITIGGQKNLTIAGYYYQAFTITADNATGVLTYDWRVPTYNSDNVDAMYVYAFIDSTPGAPVIGTEVDSIAISGLTNWATKSNIDISSKISTAGTYYVKLAFYEVLNNNAGKPGNSVAAFDNALVTFINPSNCSGTATACNTYVASGTCGAQAGCLWTSVPVYPTDTPNIYPNTSLNPTGVTSWNSFVETATKGTGEIYYQLSNDDGATWQFWDGTAWATAVLATDYNTASVINSRIGTFGVTNEKIKWKAFLSSNGSQQVSLDNVAIGYVQNDPPQIQSLSASQDTASGYVQVNYNLVDQQSDPSSLMAYEYSLTGAFAGEQSTMTPMPTDPAHSGISGLTSSPSGVAHTFVWNAAADLGNVYTGTVYVRLRAHDGIANGNYAASSAFALDYVTPIVSNLTAVQAPNSSDINIGYSLFDDTNSNITVELRISADGGNTWTVPAVSASGDVGDSVSSGNNKTIIWPAGTDYPNQENNNMMISVRAKDRYQNQGAYVMSAIFVLDNKAPVIVTPANLLAQPLAGTTAVLVGGSFAENNPNTNEFYVTVDNNDYGNAQSGDANTATPADKNVNTGTTLKGNNYIAAVKIVHTDDFGHSTINENTDLGVAYKYVKPYTPPAPAIGNPGPDSLEVTVNKHSAEVEGLEYALYESITGQYVQGDGSLSGTPYWQAVGTVPVIGLAQPVSQYIFQVKSRNISDTSYSPSSESDFSSGASSNYQSPVIDISSYSQSTDGGKYVTINYTGTDYREHTNNLVKYEFSTDNSSWRTMTEKVGAGSDGVTDLVFSSGGTAHKFVWDVGLDLPSVEDSSVYIRLQSNDTVSNSNLAVSGAFTVNTAGPVITNVSANQTVGSDTVVINYDLVESGGTGNAIEILISDDSGATYNVAAPGVSGDVGSNITAGLARSISWNAGADFSGQEKNSMRVKIRGTDKYGNVGEYTESADFLLDTKAPVISAVSAQQQTGSALVLVNYTLADLSVNNVQFEVSADSGSTWNIATNTYTGEVGAGISFGNRSFFWNAASDYPDQENSTMQIRVRALDNFGHLGAFEPSVDFSVNTKVLSIANITAFQIDGTNMVSIRYDINKNATVLIEISADSGATWTVPTSSLTGSVGEVNQGVRKSVSWNPGIDFNNQENPTMRVRISGVDSLGVASTYYESADFSVDTASPLGLIALSKFAGTNNAVTLNWHNVLDAHFNHYELWHGANRTDVANRNNTAIKWSISDDPNLSSAATIATVITGLNITSDYYVKIWAVDDYGNTATVDDVNVYTPPTLGTITVNKVVVNDEGGLAQAGDFILQVGTTTVENGVSKNMSPGTYKVSETNAANYTSAYSGDCDAEGNITIVAGNIYTCTITNNDIASVVPPTPTPENTQSVSSGGGTVAPPLDTVPPAKPILTPPVSPTQNTEVVISGLAEIGAYIQLYDNGILVGQLNNRVDDNGVFNQTFEFNEGEHVLTVKAVDEAGNVSESSDVANLTITPKSQRVLAILTPQNGDSITSAEPVLVGVAPPLSTVSIILDQVNTFTVETDAQGGWQFALPNSFGLKDGEHSFAISVVDENQNKLETVLTLNKITPIIARAPSVASVSVSVPVPPVSLIKESTEAVQVAGAPAPKITDVNLASVNDTFAFSGTALPNQDVIVYVHSDQALVYRAKANSQGVWTVNHSQDILELTPGEHSVYAVAVDSAAKIKSRPSDVALFTVEKSFWVNVFQHLNLQTTIITLAVLGFVIFWLYRLKKGGVLQAV